LPSDSKFTGFSLLACDSNTVNDPVDIPDEDIPRSFLMGRFPNLALEEEVQFSMLFPRRMATEYMYPEQSSIWTDAGGTEHDIACYVPNAKEEIEEFKCPDPFVAPIDEDFSQRNCIKVNAYSDNEYSQMWSVASTPGTIGFGLNIFMAATWYIGGGKTYKAVPFNLKMCFPCSCWEATCPAAARLKDAPETPSCAQLTGAASTSFSQL